MRSAILMNKNEKLTMNRGLSAFICMEVASENNINLICYKHVLKHYRHGFTLHVVCSIGVVPWAVQ
jgi:hypothetical protein